MTMKKLLIIVFLLASYASFGQGSWTLSGAKNRWANGMGFGNKDTSTYTNASDTNLLVLQYPGSVLCYRHLLTDHWLVIPAAASSIGYALTDLSNVLTTANLLIPSGLISTGGLTVSGNISGSTIAGTLTTAAQTNITSVGSLTGLTTTNTINVSMSAISANTVETGLKLENTATASSGNQSYSPTLELSGRAFAVGSGLSRKAGTRMYVIPVQGLGSNVKQEFHWQKVNTTATAWTDQLTITNNAGNIDQWNFGGDINTPTSITAGSAITAASLSATTVTGTLSTAAQPNITSLGTLSSLAVSGGLTAGSISTTGNISGGGLTISGMADIGTLTTTDITVNAGTVPIAAVKVNVASGAGVRVTTLSGLAVNGAAVSGQGGAFTSNNSIGLIAQTQTPNQFSMVARSTASIVTTGIYEGGGLSTTGTVTANALSGTILMSANNTATDFTIPFVSGVTTGQKTPFVSNGAPTINPNTGNLTATTFTGQLITANQPNLTSLGTQVGLTVSGTSSLTSVVASGNIQAATFTGTLGTAAQPNITSLGTLTSLVVSGNVTAGTLSSVSSTQNLVGFNNGAYALRVVNGIMRDDGALNNMVGQLISSLAGATSSRAVLSDVNGLLSAPVSSFKVKHNIKNIGYGLKEVMKMRPVWFEYNKEFERYGIGRQNGNIAEEMQKIIPEVVLTDPRTGIPGINYGTGQLDAVYIKAIQELKKQIDALEARLSALEKKVK